MDERNHQAMRIIAYLNVKGGTGKTTLALLTARALRLIGKKILFIDSDPQNAATAFMFKEDQSQNLRKAIIENDIKGNIVPTRWGFDMIPSDINLMKLGTISQSIFAKLLREVDQAYDYVIIDGLPYFNDLMKASIYASDIIVIPTTVEKWGYKSCHFMLNEIEEMEEKIKDTDIKIVMNMWQPLTKSENVFENMLGMMFREDERLFPFLTDTHVYLGSPFKRVMVDDGYKVMSSKALGTLKDLLVEITGEYQIESLIAIGN